jgi:two-component system phosphate regulon response regulator OmpR
MIKHILIVDDDDRIRILLSKFLKESGYAISTASNSKEAGRLIQEFVFDLIVLDIMMPDETGIQFIKRVKDTINTPFLLLSALGHVDDKVDGLESGAEDYLTKPFEPKELLIRIGNIIKRNSKEGKVVKFGEYEFDTKSNNLFMNGKKVNLTQTEKSLIKVLCLNLGQLVSRDEIQKAFPNVNIRTIDAQIARLRAKIEEDPKSPKYLQTVRGSGYALFG